jgi:hypothetical protein
MLHRPAASMRLAITAFVLFVTAAATQAQPQTHSCSADDVEQNVKVLPPIKALKGNGRFDVLEVVGHIYKASYRMRLIYAQIKGSCVLMGQEILEASDPY